MAGAPDPVPIERLLSHRDWVRRVAGALVRDSATADDIAQEAWLGALRQPPRSESAVRRWFRTVLLRGARDARRSAGRRDRREGAVARPEDSVLAASDLVARAEADRAVVDAVLALPEPLRTTVLLRFFEDLPPRVIADRQSVPVETVRTRIKRALVLIRDRLEGGDRCRGAPVLALLLRRDESVECGWAAAAAGAILMGFKAKAALVAAVVLLGVGWWATFSGTGDSGSGRPGPPVDSSTSLPTAPPPAARVDSPALPVPGVPEPIAARVAGRVVSLAGAPVPGALVTALPHGRLAPSSLPAPGDRTGPARSAVTAADGTFSIGLPVDDLVLLTARADGFSSAIRECVAPGDGIVLELRPARRLVVAVRDPQGRPVADARVGLRELLGVLSDDRELSTDAEGEVRTWISMDVHDTHRRSAAGFDAPKWSTTVAYDVLALTAEVRARGHAAWNGRLRPRPDGDGLRAEVRLDSGMRLAGRILDGEGDRPVAGALVVLWWRAGEGPQAIPILGAAVPGPGALRELVRTRSGPDGSFVLEGCPKPMAPPKYEKLRQWTPLLQAGAWTEGRAPAVVDVRPEETGAVGEIVIRLHPEGVLAGRTVDGTGRPVQGAVVGFWPDGEERKPATREFPPGIEGIPGERATSDGEGRFRLAGIAVPEGGVNGRVIAGLGVDRGGTSRGSRAVTALRLERSGVTAVPDLVLEPPSCGWVRVRVTREDGSPVRGAMVDGDGPYSRDQPTDSQGVALLAFFGAAKEQEIRVSAPGFGLASLKATPGASPERATEATVVLAPGWTLAGTVVGPEGAPAAGVGVWIKDGSVPLEDAFPLDPMAQAKAPELLCFPCMTGPDGRFEFTDLPEGRFHLRGFRNVPRRTLLTPPLGSVSSGTEDAVLVLPRDEGAPTGSLVVAVTDAGTAQEVPGAWVFFESPAGRWAGRSVADGVARLGDVTPGKGTLRAWAEGYREVEVVEIEVSGGTAPCRAALALDRGATVVGVLRSPGGPPPDGAVMELVALDGAGWPLRIPRATVRGDGTFRIIGVPPGRYLAQAVRGGWFGEFLYPPGAPDAPLAVSPVPVVVGYGDSEVRVDLERSPVGLLHLSPSDPRLPVPHAVAGVNTEDQLRVGREARIEVRDTGGRTLGSWTGIGRGFAGPLSHLVVPPGTYTVRLLIPGCDPREERVEVGEGGEASAEFR